MKDYLSMENLSPTVQTLTSYSNLENLAVYATSTICNVSIVDILSNGKKKEIAIAKSVACQILTEYGYGIREIGRLVNIDPKGVKVYVESHENRLADKRYAIKYNKVKSFVESYEQSNEVKLNALMELKAEYLRLSEKYDHLKELLTSN
jgi:hypothetical protein